MQQAEIKDYLKRFFELNQCECKDEGPGHTTIQLSIDMDKSLMNRPFYWHYLEKTGGQPNPMSLTFITNEKLAPDDKKGERIHFGSPRLHQIFQITKKLSSFVRLYEVITAHPEKHVALHPWLGINFNVSYQCDRKRDEFHSLGLHLISGTLATDFHESVKRLEVSGKIPDLSFTLTPLIKPKSGILRMKQYIENHIGAQDSTWAQEAHKRWEQDKALLDHFYEGLEEYPETYYKEKKAIQEQYEPTVQVEIVNGGLYYLSEGFLNA